MRVLFKDGATLGSALKTLFSIVHDLIEQGGMISRTVRRNTEFKNEFVTADNLVVELNGQPVPLSEIEAKLKAKRGPTRLAMSKYLTELAKLPLTASKAIEALDAGRRVIIVVSKDKATTTTIDGKRIQLESPPAKLKELLLSKGLKESDVAILTGSVGVNERIAQFHQ